jgi:hypothetical protein
VYERYGERKGTQSFESSAHALAHLAIREQKQEPVLDHVFITVKDLARSIAFYETALKPLGIELAWFPLLAYSRDPPTRTR